MAGEKTMTKSFVCIVHNRENPTHSTILWRPTVSASRQIAILDNFYNVGTQYENYYEVFWVTKFGRKLRSFVGQSSTKENITRGHVTYINTLLQIRKIPEWKYPLFWNKISRDRLSYRTYVGIKYWQKIVLIRNQYILHTYVRTWYRYRILHT